ncbi:MAG: hypothetical protein M3Q42_03235 [Pseudomonadota bacterium]|nr:hypothetical protein [Pseudomonadota bacterium]
MRILVLLFALAMPAIAWMSQNRMFGPNNATISEQYPTLLVAAGYAFAIWGLIFLWDIAFALWQLRERSPAVARVRPAAAAGFALTAAWLPIFSMQVFWLALLVIWAALACMAYCALALSRDRASSPQQRWWAWAPLSLHAGWLSLAAFLNTAQVIVAYGLLSTERMLGWSMVLFAALAALLLVLNGRMRGNLGYALAAVWGLAAVFVKQSQWSLPGSSTAAWVALALAVGLVGQSLWLWARTER